MVKELTYFDGQLQVWKPLEDQDRTISVLQDLEDTLETLPNRVYLCANEIGRNERAFTIKFSDKMITFFNPFYQTKENLKLVRELDQATGKQYICPRFTKVAIAYQDSLGKTIANAFNEDASIVVSQAIDRLDGITPDIFGLEVDDTFDQLSEDEKSEIIKAYLEDLQKLTKATEDEVKNDESVAGKWDALQYMQAVARGDVEFEQEEDKTISKLNRATRRLLDKLTKKKK